MYSHKDLCSEMMLSYEVQAVGPEVGGQARLKEELDWRRNDTAT